MISPPHPGLTLRDDVLPALGLTVTETITEFLVSREELHRWIQAMAHNSVYQFLPSGECCDEELPALPKLVEQPEATTPSPAPLVAESPSDGVEPAKAGPAGEKPWLVIDPRDPQAAQPWYTPARYFARQLVIKDSALLPKKEVLADKVSKSLAGTGFKKRGGKQALQGQTVLKAFSNVILG